MATCFQLDAQKKFNSSSFNKTEGSPKSLVSDIQVKYLGAIAGNVVRIVHDNTNKIFYVNTLLGDIYKVTYNSSGTLTAKIFIPGGSAHSISRVQGLLWYNNALYLAGNEVDDLNKKSKGRVIKFNIDKEGNWMSPQNVFSTEYYPSSNVLFDHNIAAICLNKTKDSLLISSGSRTDHGEVKDVNGRFPNLREDALTSKIFIIPLNLNKEIILKNDYQEVSSSGFVYCEGVRNEFDIATNSKGEIFGIENNGDRDDPEELNLLSKGKHYGFPWHMGGNVNPQQFAGYNPNLDLLLPDNLYNRAIFYNDPTFPVAPKDTKFEDPIINVGPDANWVRDSKTAKFNKDSEVATFTSHRSPVGLVFDDKNQFASPYTSDGFVLAYSTGGGDIGYLNSVDSGGDLCQMEFLKTSMDSKYKISVKRLVSGFKDLVDAVLVDNKIYLLQFDGGLYEVAFPALKSKPTINVVATSNSIISGEKVEFSASIKDYWETPEFSWRINGIDINQYSANFSSNSLANGDVVTCVIRNYFEDGSHVYISSNSIKVVVKPVFVQPTLVKTGGCVGSKLSLISNPINKLVWKKDGKEILKIGNLDSLNNQLYFFIAELPGVYSAEISTVYGNFTTNSIEIISNSVIPIISNESDDILLSSEKVGNQWYFNNKILSGDTLQKYKVTQSGNYKLNFKNSFGCISEFSKEKNVIILSIGKESKYNLSVSPNPFVDLIKIDNDESEYSVYELAVIDMNGRVLLRKKSVSSGELLDLSMLASGVYLLKFKNLITNYEQVIKTVKN